MTFDSIERSEYSGAPIELYTFVCNSIPLFRYTTAAEDVTFSGSTYTATPIKRGAITQSQNVLKTDLKIYCARNVAFVRQYIEAPPGEVVTISIIQMHEGFPNDARTLWRGRVLNVSFGENECEITCENEFSAIKRSVVNRLYQKTCPYVLYSTNQCSADINLYSESAVISSIAGLSLSSGIFSSHPNNYYSGGFVTFVKDGISDRRFISSHTGGTIVVNLPIYNLAPGDTVAVAPGCAHNLNDCLNKFNNVINYGGQPYVPSKNPMGGVPIF